MIAYLVITSLINMSLGYALAVYVSRARLRAAEAAEGPMLAGLSIETLVEQVNDAVAPKSELKAESSLAANDDDRRTEERHATWLADDNAPSLARPAANTAAAVPSAKANAAEEPAIASDAMMMEKDLLAGIEEFRLQLAKIKGQAEGEPLAEALGVTLAGK